MKNAAPRKEKHKGAALPLEADLHVLVPLQIDEVAQRLLTLQNEQIHVNLQESESSDMMDLQMTYWANSKTCTVRIIGQLRRWQGTATRFDCAGLTLGPRWLSDWLIQGLLTLLIMGITFLLLMAYYRDYWIVYDWAAMIRSWVLPPVVLVGGASFFILREVLLKNLFRDRSQAAAIALDRMMQSIANSLTIADEDLQLLAPDEDASIAILAEQQVHKHRR